MTGQKLINLEKLKNADINVPEFSVIEYEKLCGGERLDLTNLSVLKDKKTETDKFAVRSSSSAEDSDIVSFAGQFKTFLNVERNDIENKVRLCFSSLYSENIKEYAKDNDIPLDNLRMDIIIQRMVKADISGVIFTSNPQGLLNETVITVGKGLGEGVVSEKVETTTYYYSTTDKLYYYDGKEHLLTNDLIENLVEISQKIKSIIGEYLDIEFAVEKGTIYILQARKITTLTGKSPLILDNSNIVESYPGVSLPLTISFVHMVYSGVFRGVCKRVVKNEKVIDQKQDVYNNMVGNANGRLYYKISNWYTALKFLPFSSKIIPIWQEMLGVKSKSYADEDIIIPFAVRLMSYVNFTVELLSVPKSMKKLECEFCLVNDKFYSEFKNTMSGEELRLIYDEIKEKLFGVWDVTLINDMYAFIFTGLLKNRLKKRGKTDDQINTYISDISDIESMKPMKNLIDIAYYKDVYSREEYQKAKQDYIEKYGDRSLEELKLESRTFRSSPELFEERIDFYRADRKQLENLYLSLKEHGKTLHEKSDFITSLLKKKAALGIKNREISRLNRSRVYGIVRQIFITIGQHAFENGLIEDTRDIFFLTVEEAFEIPENAKEIVQERKEQYDLYVRLPAYTRLVFEKGEFDKNHSKVNMYKKHMSKNKLRGTPCSFGIAQGEVCVITDVNSANNIRGKILVTKMTDPGWVFLLAAAKGVISEKGSLLSHTAIISREMKIPSIVGVDGLLDSLQSGDYVRMDGSSGVIEILRREHDE